MDVLKISIKDVEVHIDGNDLRTAAIWGIDGVFHYRITVKNATFDSKTAGLNGYASAKEARRAAADHLRKMCE